MELENYLQSFILELMVCLEQFILLASSALFNKFTSNPYFNISFSTSLLIQSPTFQREDTMIISEKRQRKN